MLIAIKQKWVVFVACACFIGLFVSPAIADDPKIIHVAGKAELLGARGETPTQATVGAQLKPGNKIVVVGKGSVEIKVGEESIYANADDSRSSISVYSGSVLTRDLHGNNLALNADSYAVIDEQGIAEVGKGRYGKNITGKARTEKSKPAKGGKGKIGSPKDPSGKRVQVQPKSVRTNLKRAAPVKGNAGGNNAGGGSGKGKPGGGKGKSGK